MHWMVTQIGLLPWWVPAFAAVSLYWIPRFALWPFSSSETCWEFVELGETTANMAFIPFYVVYILSRTVEQLAELALLAVMLASLSVILATLMLLYIAFLDIGALDKKQRKKKNAEFLKKVRTSLKKRTFRLGLVSRKTEEG